MKRVALSVAAGFLIPFVYAATTGPLSVHIQSERVNYLLWLPVGWPKVLHRLLLSLLPYHTLQLDDTTLLVIIIACDVALYGSLTYMLLLVRAHAKPREYDEPPPPAASGGAA